MTISGYGNGLDYPDVNPVTHLGSKHVELNGIALKKGSISRNNQAIEWAIKHRIDFYGAEPKYSDNEIFHAYELHHHNDHFANKFMEHEDLKKDYRKLRKLKSEAVKKLSTLDHKLEEIEQKGHYLENDYHGLKTYFNQDLIRGAYHGIGQGIEKIRNHLEKENGQWWNHILNTKSKFDPYLSGLYIACDLK